MLIAPMISAGVVLSQPPMQHRAVDRLAAQQLLGLHRQEIAIEHGGRLHVGFGERNRRQFQRKTAGLQHAALHIIGTRAQMRVAGIDVAPGVDDADDRLAAPVGRVVARPAQPRAVTERTHVVDAEPAIAAQILRTFAVGHGPYVGRRERFSQSTDRRRGPPFPTWRFRRPGACRNPPAEPGIRMPPRSCELFLHARILERRIDLLVEQCR